MAAVALWQAELDVGDGALTELTGMLSADERARGDALHETGARRRFLADHAWRRRLLGQLTGREPAELEFVFGADGKPALDPPGPHFSASRAGPLALYAVCAQAEVGVDLEEVAAMRSVGGEGGVDQRLAVRVLAPGERAALASLGPDEQPAGLAACWARKEAYLKAMGTGLVFPLTDLDLWRGDGGPVRHGEVVVGGVTVADGLAAAVAVRVGAGAGPTVELPTRPRVLGGGDVSKSG